jgi:hypothetical protein
MPDPQSAQYKRAPHATLRRLDAHALRPRVRA